MNLNAGFDGAPKAELPGNAFRDILIQAWVIGGHLIQSMDKARTFNGSRHFWPPGIFGPRAQLSGLKKWTESSKNQQNWQSQRCYQHL